MEKQVNQIPIITFNEEYFFPNNKPANTAVMFSKKNEKRLTKMYNYITSMLSYGYYVRMFTIDKINSRMVMYRMNDENKTIFLVNCNYDEVNKNYKFIFQLNHDKIMVEQETEIIEESDIIELPIF